MLRLRNVTFMTVDPLRLAAFWSTALGLAEQRASEDEVLIADPDWTYPRFTFQRIDDRRGRGSNGVHLDLTATDRTAEVSRLVGAGAEEVRTVSGADPGTMTWTVMRDPDGNEFCVTSEN
ncbi:MAG: VOC family protein [Acidimicrobiales bacterium]